MAGKKPSEAVAYDGLDRTTSEKWFSGGSHTEHRHHNRGRNHRAVRRASPRFRGESCRHSCCRYPHRNASVKVNSNCFESGLVVLTVTPGDRRLRPAVVNSRPGDVVGHRRSIAALLRRISD